MEIVNTECSTPEFCLVRILGSGKETASSPSDGSALEGLVPVSILKPFPPQRRSGATDVACLDVASGTGGDMNCDPALTNQSPANKRRGFSGYVNFRNVMLEPLKVYSLKEKTFKIHKAS